MMPDTFEIIRALILFAAMIFTGLSFIMSVKYVCEVYAAVQAKKPATITASGYVFYLILASLCWSAYSFFVNFFLNSPYN